MTERSRLLDEQVGALNNQLKAALEPAKKASLVYQNESIEVFTTLAKSLGGKAPGVDDALGEFAKTVGGDQLAYAGAADDLTNLGPMFEAAVRIFDEGAAAGKPVSGQEAILQALKDASPDAWDEIVAESKENNLTVEELFAQGFEKS